MIRFNHKYYHLILLFLATAGLTACSKDKPASQGTNFNLLLKLETRDGGTNRKVINEYSYSPGNILNKVVSTYYNYPASPDQLTQLFYCQTGGRLDSIITTGTASGQVMYSSRSVFYYGNNGQLDVSKSSALTSPATYQYDSSVYLYNGNILQKRTDYRHYGNGIYNKICEAEFSFAGVSNPDKVIFKWTSPVKADTLRFQYDNKPNPIPAGSILQFYWAPLFYNYIQPVNNLVASGGTPENEVRYTDYQFSNNQKPLYRKALLGTSPSFIEYFYYYD